MPTSGTAYFFMYIYLDESGDLGWTLDKPYRHGGSSRYLTIISLLVPDNLRHLPKRIVKELYQHEGFNPNTEIKGADLNQNQKLFFVNLATSMMQKHPDVKLLSITVYKPNVQSHIRSDPNKLYNYMIGLSLLDKIKMCKDVYFVPDPRSIKVKSGNSLIDYLQTKLWFDLNSSATIHQENISSNASRNIQFVDIISNIVGHHYEYHNNSLEFIKISPFIDFKNLYFPKY